MTSLVGWQPIVTLLATLGLIFVGQGVVAATPHATNLTHSLNLTVDGEAVTVGLAEGEEAALSFSGRKGQRLTLQAESSNVVRFPSDIGLTYRGVPFSVVNVKTKVAVARGFFAYQTLREGDGFSFTLPGAGKYVVSVTPNQVFEGELTFRVVRG